MVVRFEVGGDVDRLMSVVEDGEMPICRDVGFVEVLRCRVVT